MEGNRQSRGLGDEGDVRRFLSGRDIDRAALAGGVGGHPHGVVSSIVERSSRNLDVASKLNVLLNELARPRDIEDTFAASAALDGESGTGFDALRKCQITCLGES